MPKKELDLRPLIAEFKKQRGTLPKVLGNIAVKQFQDNFRSEGFFDKTLSPWKKRKRETRRTRGKKILQNTGRLRRSIKRLSTTWGRIAVGTRGVNYAEVHNEGLGKMPKRQFIGHGAKLERKIKNRIEKEIRIFGKRL
jgi:phage gpG-like protein